MNDDAKIKPYTGPAGGWGSVKSVESILAREGRLISGNALLLKQNKPDGFAASAAPGPSRPSRILSSICENGAKATAWEITAKRVDAGVLRRAHPRASCESWPDHELEEAGRLTHPMRWDAATRQLCAGRLGRGVPRDRAGAESASIRRQVVFYASGRASLEDVLHVGAVRAALRHQQPARQLEHVPREHLGGAAGKHRRAGRHRDARRFRARPTASSSSARTSAPTARACCILCRTRAKRGVPIVTFNPLRERGLERFTNPQAPTEMLTGSETAISVAISSGARSAATSRPSWDWQGADRGRRRRRRRTGRRACPRSRLHRRAHARLRGIRGARRGRRSGRNLERRSGLAPRRHLEAAANIYARANAVDGHLRHGPHAAQAGVENVQMLVNLLLLRGNIGKPGAGICPVRGHSNVQGPAHGRHHREARTRAARQAQGAVRLRAAALERHDDGRGLRGHHRRQREGVRRASAAISCARCPDTAAMERRLARAAPDRCRSRPSSTAAISSTARSPTAAVPRPHRDRRTGERTAGGVDGGLDGAASTARAGVAKPASPSFSRSRRSSPSIAKATLPPNQGALGRLGGRLRAGCATRSSRPIRTIFRDFNERMLAARRLPSSDAAARAKWKTKTGKANFIVPAEPGRGPGHCSQSDRECCS